MIDIKYSGFDNVLIIFFCFCYFMKIFIKILFEWIFLFLKLKYFGVVDGFLFVIMCGICYLYGII